LLLEKPDLVVLEVDVERFPRLAQRPEFNVRSVPSLFLFRQGEMTKKISGNISILQLKEFIDA
jgi:thioredoxin-like negative regulator of GroEL